jgi:alpha-2-macroglobulin
MKTMATSLLGSRWMPRALAAAALVLALSLAGCSREAPPATPAEPALETAKVQGFGLSSWGAERHDGRPALLLEFSQPLAVSQPFDELIAVTGPDGAPGASSWVLDPDRIRLRYPYVEADASYTVRIGEGLIAAEGASLGQTIEKQIHSGALPPQVGFASQGSVLPMRNTDGLPVVSVNVSEVDVEFLRVRVAEYSNFFANYQRAGQRGWWDLGTLSGIADSVYANRFVLSGRANERSVSFLPVQTVPELREPGLYFAVLRRPGEFQGQYQTSFYFVTDLGLHARLHEDSLWVHAASLDSGQPRGGVRIEVIDARGKVMAEAATDSKGDAVLKHRPRPEDVLIARGGSEIALIPFRQPALDLADFEVGGRRQGEIEAYTWSGRDLYRPGERLQVSALLRDFDGRALESPQPLFARLLQPDGRAVSDFVLEPGALGYYETTQPIRADAPTGRWALELRASPEAKPSVGRFEFRVEEFLPERMKLSLDAPPDPLEPGAALSVSIEGAYLYGAPAAGNRVTGELAWRVDAEAVPKLRGYRFGDATLELPAPAQAFEAELDAKGRSLQSIDLLGEGAGTASPLQAILNVSLFESGGRAIRRSLVRSQWPAEVLVGLRPLFDLKDGPGTNTQAGFELVRSDAQGALRAGTGLEVQLLRAQRDSHWSWIDGSGWKAEHSTRWIALEKRSLDFNGARPARIELPVEWGEYRIEVRDPATGLTTRLPFFAGWRYEDDNRGLDARPDKVKLALDKPAYSVGDIARITLTAPYAGPGLLLVESDRLLLSQAIDLRPGSVVEVPISAAMNRHDVYATILLLRPGQQADQPGPNRAIGVVHLPMAREDRSLALSLRASDAPIRPGQPILITLEAANLAGQSARVSVDAVDQGILSLTRYPVPDPLAWFLSRRALSVEAWDLYGRVIERFQGQRARLRFGGDAVLPSLPQARRPTARVQTVALHAGPVEFDAAGRAVVRFIAPDFNGALRLAAVAFSEDRFGHAEGELIVRAPLVLEASSPRVMAPGDRAKLHVDLQNLSGEAAAYAVSAQAEGPIAISGGPQSVALADGARRSLQFDLVALPGNGVATRSGRPSAPAAPSRSSPDRR